MNKSSALIVVAVAFMAAIPAYGRHGSSATGVATIPMVLALNRPYVDLTLMAVDGKPIRARFWLDTGGGAVLLSAGLAKRLGLHTHGKPMHEEGSELAATDVPQIRVGKMPLKLLQPEAFILLDSPDTLQGTDAQGALPLRMLSQYHVVFDYPGRRFTLAEAGKLRPRGTEVKSWIGKAGMPVVTLKLDGGEHDFLMDTGGTYCMISASILDALAKRHPEWPRVQGAYGPANMLLGSNETKLQMMRIGDAQWGDIRLTGTGAVSRPTGTYEKWMSQIAGRPLAGSIGGNVLQWFRVDIDYPAGKVYLSGKPGSSSGLNMIGIMIERGEGGYVIVKTAAGVTAVHVGDKLLKVGNFTVGHASLAVIMQALAGRPGEMRRLEIERDGKRMQVTLPVQRIL